MPRLVGYNTLQYNDAPYNGSGYYAVTDTQVVTYSIYDATVTELQSATYDIRQIALQAQQALWDDTNPITDTQLAAWDITHPIVAKRLCIGFSVGLSLTPSLGDGGLSVIGGNGALAPSLGDGGLSVIGGNGALARLTGDAVLRTQTPCWN